MCNVFLLTFSSRSEPPRDRRCVPHDAATAYRDAVAATASTRFRSAAGLRGEVCPLPWFNFLSFPEEAACSLSLARAAFYAHRSKHTPRNSVLVRSVIILCSLHPASSLTGSPQDTDKHHGA